MLCCGLSNLYSWFVKHPAFVHAEIKSMGQHLCMFLTTAAMCAMLRVQLDPAIGLAACPHKVIVYLPACHRYPVQADCHTTEHVRMGRMSPHLPFSKTTLILR